MVKIQSNSRYALISMVSIVLNLFLLYHLFVGGKWELSWTTRAALEAEAVASLSCSGHGRAYLDGILLDGNNPGCECNTCFNGSDCSEFIPGCAADVDSGDPVFLEPFWMDHAASSAILVSGWHRMSYIFNDHSSMSKELEKHILRLHASVGNAVTEGRFIVFGAGSTPLLNAAVHALAMDNSSSLSRVVASNPFYPAYKEQTNFFESTNYEFYGDTSLLKNTSDYSMNVIEFVTSPNNPDGQLKKAVLHGPSHKTIHDHAYYWPHFTSIPIAADEDLMLFTLSKLTGHAGVRFGWALIKDETVYQRMSEYVEVNTLGVSRDIQLRALKLLRVILEEEGCREIFDFGYQTMRKRWEKLSQALLFSKRFSIQEIAPQYCTFFQGVRGPSPAYAWLKCEREEDEDCFTVLRAAGIISREGTRFSAESRYVRLSLIKRQDDFDLLLLRLNKLVSEESVYIKTLV